MPVGIIVQNDAGTVSGANAYIAVADFQAYHALRGNDVSAYTSDQIASAVIRATDYIDNRFEFPGAKLTGAAQPTMWPRQDVPDIQTVPQATTNYAYWLDSVWPLIYPGATIDGLDQALKNATAEYALVSLQQNLLENNPANAASKGGGIIDTITTKIDVLEITRKFRPMVNGAAVWPAYPVADNYLRARGLVLNPTGRTIMR